MKLSEIKLDHKKIYFLIPLSRGDVFISIFFIRWVKETRKTETVLIIKEEHAFIAEMLQMPFICADFTHEEVSSLDIELTPEKGKIFLVSSVLHKELPVESTHMLSFYKMLFDMPFDAKMDFHFPIPALMPDLVNKIEKIAPLNKIVLFSPQAITLPALEKKYWECLAEEVKKQGFTVISSVLNEQEAVKGTVYIKLNCEEALQLAYHCHAVYALRSGFADMCFQLGKKLTVVYPSFDAYRIYGMKKLFNRDDIVEKIVNVEKKEETKFYLLKKIHIASLFKQKDEVCFFICYLPVIKIKRQLYRTNFYLFGLPIFSKKIKRTGYLI